MTTITRRALLAAFPLARVLAGDFWEEKRYSQWDEREVEQMLTDSPWAKKVPVKPDATALVRWESALPVQMAIARRDQGFLSVPSVPRRWKAYVITVSGITIGGLPRDSRDRKETLMAAARLKPAGGVTIQPDTANFREGIFEFQFPNDDPSTVAAPALDFTMRLGRVVVKHRFHTAQMTFEGKLAV